MLKKAIKFIFNFNNNYILYFYISIISILLGYLSLGKNINIDVYPIFANYDKIDDTPMLAMLVKSIKENGLFGLYFNNRIGAPEISALIDYPCCDLLMGIIIWIMSWFINSIPIIIHSYFIMTFVLNSVSMAWFLRKLKINVECTFVISLLFSFSYYHFWRYIKHITLSNYISFALTMYLVCCILDIFENENKYTIVICSILLGIGCPYYWFMGGILIVLAYIVKFFKDKKISKLYIFLILIIAIFIGIFPKLYYSLHNGKNYNFVKRNCGQQEKLGLKITKLFIPNDNSKIKLFRDISKKYSSGCFITIGESSSSYLGVISIIGFIALFAFFIYYFFLKDIPNTKYYFVSGFLSFSAVFLILFATSGGFGYIFNMLITPIIRCQNRFSIFIMGLSLVFLAIIINKIAEHKRLYSYLICFIILLFGMFEQYEVKNVDYEILANMQKKYKTFFAVVEEKLPNNSMVYQLPYTVFPEGGPKNKMLYYQHFIGYLFSKNLKWSYGGMRGRNLTAEKLNINNGMSYSFLKNIKNTGFNAVYIDTDGYEDEGKKIIDFYNNLNIKPIISEDKKLYVYDISNVSFNEVKNNKIQ